MTSAMPAPFDVRLMNITASVLFFVCAVLLLAAAGWWALRHPLFALGGITVQGDVSHSNAVTLRANQVVVGIAFNLLMLGVSAYLRKPFAMDVLLEAVANALKKAESKHPAAFADASNPLRRAVRKKTEKKEEE